MQIGVRPECRMLIPSCYALRRRKKGWTFLKALLGRRPAALGKALGPLLPLSAPQPLWSTGNLVWGKSFQKWCISCSSALTSLWITSVILFVTCLAASSQLGFIKDHSWSITVHRCLYLALNKCFWAQRADQFQKQNQRYLHLVPVWRVRNQSVICVRNQRAHPLHFCGVSGSIGHSLSFYYRYIWKSEV